MDVSVGDEQAQERPLLLDHTLTIWSAKASFLLEISIKSPSFLEGGQGTPIAPKAPPHHQATCPSERGPPAGSWPGADPTNRISGGQRTTPQHSWVAQDGKYVVSLGLRGAGLLESCT